MISRTFRPLLPLILLLAWLPACRQTTTPEPAAASLPAKPTAGAPQLAATPLPRAAATSVAAAPGALAVSPAQPQWQADYPSNQPYVLRFSQPMDPASSATPLRFTPAISGDFQWNETATELTFVPRRAFQPKRRYLVALDPALRSAAGILPPPATWEFDVAPLPVITRRDNPGSNTSRHPTFLFRFNREMDRESVLQAFWADPEMPASFHWEGMELALAPQQPLEPGQVYNFGFAGTATDLLGVPLASGYRWPYRPAPLFAAPPRLLEPGQRSSPLRLSLNYAMDPATFAAAFRLNGGMPGRFAWNAERTEVTFYPAEPLLTNTAYTLSLQGELRDAQGEPFPLPEAVTFTTPAPILASLPQGNGISPATEVRLTFDRPMDREATAGAFHIEPAVPGTISWEGNSLIFTPEEGVFQESTRYQVTVDQGILDTSGQAILDNPFSWAFRTGPLASLASFGGGPRLQVVGTEGRRAVQFQAFQDTPVRLALALYPLSQAEFLTRYPQAAAFRWNDQGAEPMPQPATPPVAGWSMRTTEKPAGTYLNVQELVIPESVPPGLYLLDLTAGKLNDQMLIVLTGHTLALKQDEKGVLAWLTAINGEAAAGASLVLYDKTAEMMARATSGADGLARFPLAGSAQPDLVLAQIGEDTAVSGLGGPWRASGWWWGGDEQAQAVPPYAAYVYTERPIYRPGQRVYFKAIVRHDDDASLSQVGAGTPLTVRIRDSRNNVVQTIPLVANDMGTANGTFLLAEGAMLGRYTVELEVDGARFSQVFKVEDYRKPDYQVQVISDKEAYVAGESIILTVQGRYFFDQPLSGATVTLQRYSLANQYDWLTGENLDAWFPFYSENLPRGRLDDQGSFQTVVSVAGAFGEYDTNYENWGSSVRRKLVAIEATVDDGSNQSVSGYARIAIYSAAEDIRLDTGGFVHQPGQPFTVKATVQDIWGSPVDGRRLELSLRRWNNQTYHYDTVVQSATLATDAAGHGQAAFTVAENGYYQLRAEGKDSRGNNISYETWVYVFAGGHNLWYGSSHALGLVAERESYAPGDTARLLIESGFGGPALLTFERATVRRQQLVSLTPPLTVVDVPILLEDTPNIYVTVSAWQAVDNRITDDMWSSLPDSQLLTASVNLQVPASSKVLTVSLSPDKPVYAPGEEASFTVQVSNYLGQPVSAEVSLALVDEAIFSLSPELSGPIYEGFYFNREDRVLNHNSMAPFRYLAGGGRGGGGGGEPPANPRQDLPDTAAWFPALRTDAAGMATVSLALPDNVTSWRLTAKAVTVDTQVGESSSNIVTQKPFLVRPLLPRTLTSGDEVTISAIVHNFSPAAQTLLVYLDAGNVAGAAERPSPLRLNGEITRTVTLQAGDQAVVGWPVVAAKAGEATVTVWATLPGGDIADAVRLPLTVRPLAVPDVTVQVGQFDAPAWETTLAWPASALEVSSIRIDLSRSIAGSLTQGLDYLTGYPYGCVEQTMSAALPNAVVARAFRQLGLSNLLEQAGLDAKIVASIQRLYGFQHDDGGWGWWFDDNSDAYNTAWVLFGLSSTADAGYEVDPEVVSRGAEWLRGNLAGMDQRTRAFALYGLALSGQGEPQAAQTLFSDRGRLDSFSKAALALALWQSGQSTPARTLVDELADAATILDNGQLFWKGSSDDGHYDQKVMASTTRSTALVLRALVAIRPGHELEAGAVRYLMGQRRQQGWGSTNETSFAILALTDHLLRLRQAEAGAGTSYAVELNGTPFASGSLDGNNVAGTSLTIPAEALQAGENRLRIRQTGQGTLYYVVTSRVFLPQAAVDAAGVISLSRTYFNAQTQQAVTQVVPGQLVRVELVVNAPASAAYVIIEDSLPGGLEALNEGLNTASHEGSAFETRYRWQELGYNYKEVRGDRVSFFITEMAPGRQVLTYFARATREGTFVAMPAEASAMYDPATWGRSASNSLVVAPANAGD